MAHSVSQFIYMKENIFLYKEKKNNTVRKREQQSTKQSKSCLRSGTNWIRIILFCRRKRRFSKHSLEINSKWYSEEDYQLNHVTKDIFDHDITHCRDEIRIIYISVRQRDSGDQNDKYDEEKDKLEYIYCVPIIQFSGASPFKSAVDVSVGNHTSVKIDACVNLELGFTIVGENVLDNLRLNHDDLGNCEDFVTSGEEGFKIIGEHMVKLRKGVKCIEVRVIFVSKVSDIHMAWDIAVQLGCVNH